MKSKYKFPTSKDWGKWATFFIPLMIAAQLLRYFFGDIGDNIVWSILAIALPFTLLYQRYFKNRSWKAILWGEQNK